MMKFKCTKLKKTTTSRTDVWYTDRFTNGFTKFETNWKASLYHLEEDGDGSYPVSNLTESWNPEIARSLAVFTLSVLYFSVIWYLSLIFQLVFCPNVCISNFILGNGKIWRNFILLRYLAVRRSLSFEQF